MTQHTAHEQQGLDLLQRAFYSFDQAAVNLQESYRALKARVEQLDLELAASNEALRINLNEKEEMRSHLAAVLESLTTGVIVADQQERIVRCNQAAEALLGVERSRVLGRRLGSVLHETGLDGGCYPIVSPTGAALSLSRAMLKGDGGRQAGSIVLLHDISAIRTLEERFRRRERLAAMGEMVGRIAHEIRNPLGSVELFASLLRKDLAHDSERRRYAEHILTAVHALNRLLTNLLTYTRPDCSRSAWHQPEPLVREALALAAREIERARIETRFLLEDGVERIWCDAAQMKQVLVNLILNAAQAMPSGGTLSIRVFRNGSAGSELKIAVSDTGIGIDPAHLSRVFDPFFTTRDEGTGLGLAIVHAIVEGHRGRVEVESALGRGTTVTVVLPEGNGPGKG